MMKSQKRQLCEMLGHLPLAIQIVGSDLAQATDITVDEYIELLEDESERLVENFSDESRGIRATFELSYSRRVDRFPADLVQVKSHDLDS